MTSHPYLLFGAGEDPVPATADSGPEEDGEEGGEAELCQGTKRGAETPAQVQTSSYPSGIVVICPGHT